MKLIPHSETSKNMLLEGFYSKCSWKHHFTDIELDVFISLLDKWESGEKLDDDEFTIVGDLYFFSKEGPGSFRNAACYERFVRYLKRYRTDEEATLDEAS